MEESAWCPIRTTDLNPCSRPASSHAQHDRRWRRPDPLLSGVWFLSQRHRNVKRVELTHWGATHSSDWNRAHTYSHLRFLLPQPLHLSLFLAIPQPMFPPLVATVSSQKLPAKLPPLKLASAHFLHISPRKTHICSYIFALTVPLYQNASHFSNSLMEATSVWFS